MQTVAPPRSCSVILKRLFDVAVSAIVLILLTPLFVAIVVIVRLESHGPAIFSQTRIGRCGTPFTMFKFRSMYHHSDDSIHRAAIENVWTGTPISNDPSAPFKLSHDTRITRVGSILRYTSIDEIPQFYNVLRGDMSIVGPRPMLSYELKNFQPHHHARHRVLPGITGLAQVTNRGRAKMDDILNLDLKYISQRSFLTDLKLIMKTFAVIFMRLGAR